VPRRFVAIGIAALATAGSGVGAIVTATAPVAAHASCLSDFNSRTSVNESDNAPGIYNQGGVIGVKEGSILLFGTNESQYTFLFLECVGVGPSNAS
jgi:hypothetical protein